MQSNMLPSMNTEEDVLEPDADKKSESSSTSSPSKPLEKGVTSLQIGGSTVQEQIHQSVALMDARQIRQGK